jgi:hypothetical protein
LIRIYQIAPENKPFLDALIIATNSQNAIRPEDLLSNDTIQKALQHIYREYGIGYERKEGETLPGHGYVMTFSKEQAGMAYLAVFMGSSSRLRNSLSRREFFRQGDDYYRAFHLRGDSGDDSPGALPDGFQPGEPANRRALQILAARRLEEDCRSGIGNIEAKEVRGSLRKGAYYLARVIYLKHKREISELILKAATQDRKADVARKFIKEISNFVAASFDDARNLFQQVLKDYLVQKGGNEDAALKNTEFAKRMDQFATAPTPPD